MRKQTKKMLDLLERDHSVEQRDAEKNGVHNPRREAAVLKMCYDYPVVIVDDTGRKRSYNLN